MLFAAAARKDLTDGNVLGADVVVSRADVVVWGEVDVAAATGDPEAVVRALFRVYRAQGDVCVRARRRRQRARWGWSARRGRHVIGARSLTAADATTFVRSAITMFQRGVIGLCDVLDRAAVAPLAAALGGAVVRWMDADASGAVTLLEYKAWLDHVDTLDCGPGS